MLLKLASTCIMAPGRSLVQWSPKQLITTSVALHIYKNVSQINFRFTLNIIHDKFGMNLKRNLTLMHDVTPYKTNIYLSFIGKNSSSATTNDVSMLSLHTARSDSLHIFSMSYDVSIIVSF